MLASAGLLDTIVCVVRKKKRCCVSFMKRGQYRRRRTSDQDLFVVEQKAFMFLFRACPAVWLSIKPFLDISIIHHEGLHQYQVTNSVFLCNTPRLLTIRGM